MLRLCSVTAIWLAALACGTPTPAPPPSVSEDQAAAPQGARAPHVLLLSVDTLRPDYLSFNGYDRPTSPFVDAVLERGTYFEDAISPVGRTTPALASLLTGAYPHGTGVRRLNDVLPADRLTLAEVAQAHGFQTVAVVSNHIITPKRALHQGFTVYDHDKDTRDAAGTTAAAIDHLSKLDASQPIFAWVHYIDPHAPYYPPAKIARAFDPDYTGRYAAHFGSKPGGTGASAYPEDLSKRQAVFANPLPEAVNAHVRRLYAADIRATDLAIADLLRWLRSTLGPDWIIVFTSDHGESLGEHDYYWDHGDYVSSAELRVPLGFTFPKGHPLDQPHRVKGWVSLVDVFPTLVDVMGWRVPDLPYAIDGVSLRPQLEGGPAPTRAVFAESGASHFPELVKRRTDFTVPGRFRAAYQGALKVVWTPGFQEGPEHELFAPYADPAEATDLWDSRQEDAADLKVALHAWVRDDAAPEAELDDEEAEALRSLGYTE